jgi:hypothetical protein
VTKQTGINAFTESDEPEFPALELDRMLWRERDETRFLLDFLSSLQWEIHAADISPEDIRSVLAKIDAEEEPSEQEMRALDGFNELGRTAIRKALKNRRSRRKTSQK